jgi:hypothetical protein
MHIHTDPIGHGALAVTLAPDTITQIAHAVAEHLSATHDHDHALTLREAAQIARRSERTISRAIAAGQLRASKSGPAQQARVTIMRSDLLAYLRGDR